MHHGHTHPEAFQNAHDEEWSSQRSSDSCSNESGTKVVTVAKRPRESAPVKAGTSACKTPEFCQYCLPSSMIDPNLQNAPYLAHHSTLTASMISQHIRVFVTMLEARTPTLNPNQEPKPEDFRSFDPRELQNPLAWTVFSLSSSRPPPAQGFFFGGTG